MACTAIAEQRSDDLAHRRNHAYHAIGKLVYLVYKMKYAIHIIHTILCTIYDMRVSYHMSPQSIEVEVEVAVEGGGGDGEIGPRMGPDRQEGVIGGILTKLLWLRPWRAGEWQR